MIKCLHLSARKLMVSMLLIIDRKGALSAILSVSFMDAITFNSGY